MPMTLNIVLPVTLDSDSVCVISDDEEFSNTTSSVRCSYGDVNRVNSDKNHNNNNIDIVCEPRDGCGRFAIKSSEVIKVTKQDKVNLYRRNNQDNSHNGNQQTLPWKKYNRQQQHHSRYLAKEQQTKTTVLPQTQHQTKTTVLPQTQHQISNGNMTHGYLVVLDKSTRRHSSSSAPIRLMEQPNDCKQRQRSLRDVRLSVTDTYDIEQEHRDIMMKALKSYSQHCRCERDDRGNDLSSQLDRMRKTNVPVPHNKGLSVVSAVTPRDRRKHHFNENEKLESSEMIDNPRVVKMSQCRLKYYDDDNDKGTQLIKNIKSNRSTLPHTPPLLYTLDNGNGVLADAMGHVYRSKQIQSWSALPRKLTDLVKVDREGICSDGDRRHQDTVRSSNNGENKTRSRNTNSTSSHSKIQTTAYGGNMSQPISHSLAFQRRNQTTHMWTDSSQFMSQSVPGASFLHQHFGSSFSSPRSSRDDSSEITSPAGKVNRARPSSSYSYDGGFFVGAHSQAEYFVIHPDWVSESMTLKRLSINDKKAGSPLQRSSSLSLRIPPDGRRCLSAPPKQRNPITMGHNEPSNKTSN